MRAVEYKGGKCQVCGYSRSIAALDFHHRDPNQKDFGIGGAISYGWERIRAEVDKCDLLCKCCHAEEHDRIRAEKIGPQQELIAKHARVLINKTCSFCSAKLKGKKAEGNSFCDMKCKVEFYQLPEQLEKLGRKPWPSNDEFSRLLWKFPLTELGKKFGVSGNSVKKRAQTLGIPAPGQNYWSKKRNEKV